MKNTKLYLVLVLLLPLFFVSACSDDKDNEDINPINEAIKHVDILGVYKVQTLQGNDVAEVKDGDIWSIKVKHANISCSPLEAYAYKNNTLTVADKSYAFAISEFENTYQLTYSGGGTPSTFLLVKTTEKCGDQGEGETEITKAEILGKYKVADAYSNESGVEPAQNTALLGKIWNIQDASIMINCATEAVEYTYADNTILAQEIKYEVEKVAGKLVITYLIDNIITSVHLETTTEDCPEEEGPTVGKVELDKMYGYAEAAGTTGGEGGAKHHFDNGYQFRDWLKLREKAKSKEPAIVWLSGEFTKDHGRGTSPWFDIKDTENLTIYGTNSFKMKNVGFFLVRANNIIIRNIYIEMPKADNGADGISMQKSSKIWVDHCTFESVNSTKDYEDGSCDITHGTHSVTVSWNHFIKTQKTALVGHSNGETADKSITATFHHNFFDESNSRHPRVRFGNVHVFNNFFNKVSTYAVGSAYGAKVLVEANNFDGVHLPTDICTFPAKKSGNNWVSNLQGSEAGYLFEAENFYTNKPSNSSDPYPFINLEFLAYEGGKLPAPLTRADFTPTYTYVVDKAEEVSTIVPSGAGVGKLPNFGTAPVAVDNGGMPEPGEEPDPGEETPGEGVDLGNDWMALNIGASTGSASVIADGQGLSISGAGKLESGTQVLFYVYREISGDFEITARADSYETAGTSNQSQSGLMLIPNLSETGTNFLHAGGGLGGVSKYYYTHRIEAAKNASKGELTVPTTSGGETYIKLKREGDKYTVAYSLDGGVTYGKDRTGTFTVPLPTTVNVGFYVTSGDSKKLATGKFSDIKLNGTAIGFED